MLEPVVPLSKEDRRRAKQAAVQQAERERALQLQRQQFVVDRLKTVDTTLRFPFMVGRATLDVAHSLTRRLYEDLVSLPGGFRRLVLAPNVHKDELGGHLVEYDHRTTGVKSSAILSRKHPFGVVAVFALKEAIPGTLTSLRGLYAAKLKESVAAFPRDSPRLRSVLPASTDDFHDAERWKAYLPVHSRVGLYRKDGGLYLIIVTHAGHDLVESVDDILAEERTTIGRFTVDRRVRRLQKVVVRNVRRVATRIISDLNQVEGGQKLSVKTDDDPRTRLVDDLSYYELARPARLMKLNHMHLDVSSRSVRVYVDAACQSAMITGRDDYAQWCGRTRDYLVAPLPNDNDGAVLPLKTDKLPEEERTPVVEEEHEVIGAHVQYVTPRSESVGAFVKYRAAQTGRNTYKHVSSVHI